MMAENVQIGGLREVLAKLEGIEPHLKRKIMLSAARTGANKLKKAAAALAPVKTGALKRSLSVRQMSRSLQDVVGAMVIVRTGGNRTKKQKLAREDAFYWFWQEYGWVAGGKWRTKKNTGLTRSAFRAKNTRERVKQPGKHFILRGFESQKQTVKQDYMDAIQKGVNRYVG